jgi:hypothetical protein
MNQFGQKKKFEGGEKGNLGKTHFGGYSVTRVCKILIRVFLVKIGFFFVFSRSILSFSGFFALHFALN